MTAKQFFNNLKNKKIDTSKIPLVTPEQMSGTGWYYVQYPNYRVILYVNLDYSDTNNYAIGVFIDNDFSGMPSCCRTNPVSQYECIENDMVTYCIVYLQYDKNWNKIGDNIPDEVSNMALMSLPYTAVESSAILGAIGALIALAALYLVFRKR